MTLRVTWFRASRRAGLPWVTTGAAACLISVGGFQLWQAAAVEHQAVVGQTRAAITWDSASDEPASLSADWTHAIARLASADHDIDLFVLPDSDWDSLMSGPGLFAGPTPGAAGTSVIAGHRETHFAFLRDLAIGEVLTVTDRDGRRTEYQVTDAQVVDGRSVRVGGDTPDDAPSELLLVTCYPFDTTEIGPERYVVSAIAL